MIQEVLQSNIYSFVDWLYCENYFLDQTDPHDRYNRHVDYLSDYSIITTIKADQWLSTGPGKTGKVGPEFSTEPAANRYDLFVKEARERKLHFTGTQDDLIREWLESPAFQEIRSSLGNIGNRPSITTDEQKPTSIQNAVGFFPLTKKDRDVLDYFGRVEGPLSANEIKNAFAMGNSDAQSSLGRLVNANKLFKTMDNKYTPIKGEVLLTKTG